MEEVEVSTGVKFRIKPAPPLAFRDIQRKLRSQEPKVPIVWSEEKGREEENPHDPDYLRRLTEHQEQLNLTLWDAAILLCTKAVSIPEGIAKPEDDFWREDMRILGLDSATGSRENYLAWVKYCAAPTEQDIEALSTAILRLSGVTEEEAAASAASFPG